MREIPRVRLDEERLYELIAGLSFEAFPGASHLVLATRPPGQMRLETRMARTRDREAREITLARMVAERVMVEESALLVAFDPRYVAPLESAVIPRLQTALCAPLIGSNGPFGVLQLEKRGQGAGLFTRADLELLALIVNPLALAWTTAVSTGSSATPSPPRSTRWCTRDLRDPDTAQHSERVQAVALIIGAELGLSTHEMDILSMAALLHDLGKQGVRDEVLYKPGRLTPEETAEMAAHAAYTQNILDRIEYPEPLKSVPEVAAYHHEKMSGTGPYGIPGDRIPNSRIISVADAFDAMVSARVYREDAAESHGHPEGGSGFRRDATVVEVRRRGRCAAASTASAPDRLARPRDEAGGLTRPPPPPSRRRVAPARTQAAALSVGRKRSNGALSMACS
jgi:HD-GYP domain-containing protein (c-di-GMP phosphodiesterase class II)